VHSWEKVKDRELCNNENGEQNVNFKGPLCAVLGGGQGNWREVRKGHSTLVLQKKLRAGASTEDRLCIRASRIPIVD